MKESIAISSGKYIFAGGLIIFAVSLFYIPLPYSSYPADIESRRIVFQYNTLASVGLSPWLLAIALWQLFEYGHKHNTAHLPTINAFAFRVLVTTLAIAVLYSWQFQQSSQYWLEAKGENRSILLPALSLVAGCFIFVFIARLLESLARGWGVWILICAISLSGICINIRDILDAYNQTALSFSDIFIALALTSLSFAVAVFTVSATRLNLGEKGLSLVYATLVVETSIFWTYKLLQSFMMAQPDRAIFFETHLAFFKWSIFALIGLIVSLIWIKHWPKASKVEKLISITGILALNAIGTYLARTQHFPLLATVEIMTLACGAIALYQTVQNENQSKSLQSKLKPKFSKP